MQNLEDVLESVRFVQGDIRDKPLLLVEMAGADYVLHLAAMPSVPRSLQQPEDSFRSNVEGTLQVLLAARDAKVRRVVYASSSSVYGENPTLPKVETMPAVPISLYGTYKLGGELMTRNFYWLYGLETVCLRYFNVFGPNQDPNSQYAAVIPKFITSMARDEQPIIFGDGKQTRDFTYVDNVVHANILACLAQEAACGETFNIACSRPYSLNDLVVMINRQMNKNLQPIYQEPRPGDIKHSYADISKARRLLGYDIQVSTEEGLRRTIQSLQ
jgi:UDP-glucose 4-epimerase